MSLAVLGSEMLPAGGLMKALPPDGGTNESLARWLKFVDTNSWLFAVSFWFSLPKNVVRFRFGLASKGSTLPNDGVTNPEAIIGGT